MKLRVIGRQQQLLRIDFETRAVARGARVASSTSSSALLADADAVVLSDYGKGGLDAHRRDDRARARRPASRVLVDPKGDD